MTIIVRPVCEVRHFFGVYQPLGTGLGVTRPAAKKKMALRQSQPPICLSLHKPGGILHALYNTRGTVPFPISNPYIRIFPKQNIKQLESAILWPGKKIIIKEHGMKSDFSDYFFLSPYFRCVGGDAKHKPPSSEDDARVSHFWRGETERDNSSEFLLILYFYLSVFTALCYL